jgi:hypothetical protein
MDYFFELEGCPRKQVTYNFSVNRNIKEYKWTPN